MILTKLQLIERALDEIPTLRVYTFSLYGMLNPSRTDTGRREKVNLNVNFHIL